MKKISSAQKILVVTLSMFLAGSPYLHAEEGRAVLSSDEKKPLVIETSTDSVTATVVDIDYKTRLVTLRNSDGDTITMEAGPEIVRLKEIRKKDLIKVDYLESTAIVVQSADKQVASVEGEHGVIVRNQSKLPSGAKIETEVVTVSVVSVNPEKRTLVVKGPQGNEFKVNIAPDVNNLDNVKKGDRVTILKTRTLAIAVSKP